MNYADPKAGLFPGCCSAASPCNHQKHDPTSLCAVCDPLPKSDNIRPKAERQPLSGDDYFRLLGAFGERARCIYQVKQALGRAHDARNRVPLRHRVKWKAAHAVCEPLRHLLDNLVRELGPMREAIEWETKHGHH